MDKIIISIAIIAFLIFGGILGITAYQFSQDTLTIECADIDYQPKECECNIDELCDFPVYECYCDKCEECPECITFEDELIKVKSELNKWKADFDKNIIYDLCRKDKKFCDYL